MNAIEFVKKYGWEECQWVCNDLFGASNDGTYNFDGDIVDVGDLKRLVESYELVMEHGSLERAREYAESPYTAPEVIYFLAKAIFDVEKCQ